MDPKTYGNPPLNRTEVNRIEEQRGTSGDVRAKAQDLAHEVKDKATEVSTQVKDKASQAGAQASEKLDVAMSSAGQQMSTLAQTVRERAPSQGRVGEIAESTATALERSGRYLQQANVDTVRMDLEGVIRRHPVESLLVGLGMGFLMARSMRR